MRRRQSDRKGAVRGAALLVGRSSVDGRTHQRMPEPDPASLNTHQPDPLSLLQPGRSLRRSLPYGLNIVAVARRREQQRLAAFRIQPPDPCQERPLHARGHRDLIVKRPPPRSLIGIQDAGKLQQRERVARDHVTQCSHYLWFHVMAGAADQLRRRSQIDTAKTQLRNAVHLKRLAGPRAH